MAFNREAFDGAPLDHRTKDVPVPDLAAWFDGDGGAVWKVRGLTSVELARVNASEETGEKLQAVVAAIAGRVPVGDKVEAFQSILGLGSDLPSDYVRRLELLIHGSVDPVCDRPLALRLAHHFPIEFYQLTNEITKLTGMGSAVGESNGSGATPASEPPSTSGTASENACTSSDPTSSPTGD